MSKLDGPAEETTGRTTLTYDQHRVGLNTALAGLIALIATKFGVDIPNGVIVAAIGLVAIVTAYFSPGWADKVGLEAYPAGITAAVVTVLSWLLPTLGVHEFSQADLVVLIGSLTLIVSLFTPAGYPDLDPDGEVSDLDRERVGE